MPSPVWAANSTWKPTITKRVWNGSAYVRVKKEVVWDGTNWNLAWVHPVTTASLSFTKTGVYTGEAYNVILTAPGTFPNGGFPQGAAVTFRFTGYAYTVYPTEGSNSVTLVGASHSAAGNTDWYADVVTEGGTTTFGPLRQTTTVQTGTVTLAGPAWVLSTASGAGGAVSAQPAVFTVTLGTPALVASMDLELQYAGGAWTAYKTWTSPGATSTHSQAFSTQGSWKARVKVTQTNAAVVYSAEHAIYCYKKSLSITVTPSNPTAGDVVTLRATHSGDALGSTYGRWRYYYSGAWHDDWSTANPQNWTTSAVAITWQWVENFAEGSVIYSNQVAMNIPAPNNDYVLNGTAHCHDIQAAMNAAKSQGKKLVMSGKFYLYTNVYIPDNLYIDGSAATFYCNSTSAVAGAGFDAGRFKNDPKGNAGQYGQAGGFTFDGGTFDGNGEGIMTFSHSPGYTIQNCTFYRYCSSGNTGHAIEINSSGGADNVSGPYTVQILNNLFRGADRGQRSNSNDEPVHYDWNWGSSDGSADSGASDPLWRPGNSISESSQVMCHNVRIAGNNFHRISETGGWEFAKCAIGGHDSSDDAVRPTYRHNHFLIENNVIHGAVGSTGTNPDKGAIHLFRGRQFIARNNTLYGGVQNRYITAEDSGDVGYCTATGNTSANPTLSNPNSIIIQNA